jgi:hypothetical protein
VSTPVITGVGSPLRELRSRGRATIREIKLSVSILACAGITHEAPGALLTRAENVLIAQSVIADATSKFWYTWIKWGNPFVQRRE